MTITPTNAILAKTKMLGVGSIASNVKTLNKVTQFIPTGTLPLDIIMGGGTPVGRMIEIYGDNSTGKTLVGLHIIKQVQDMGGVGVLFDTEVSASDDVMDMIGIDRDALIYRTPETVESVWAEFTDLVEAKRASAPDIPMAFVWDSVAGTSSEEELESVKKKGLSSHTMAVHARILSQMGRLLPQMISKSNIAAVLINQTRENIGVMFGEQKSTFGGRSIGYYASVRLELSTAGKVKSGLGYSGVDIRAFVSKNKLAPPFGKCTLPIVFGHGIDEAGAIFEWLRAGGSVISSGSWWNLKVPGAEIRFQRANWPETLKQYDAQIRQYVCDHAGFAFTLEEEE